MPLDLNQDQNHNHLSSSSSSFSSPSSSSYPNPPEQVRQEPSYYFETKHDPEEVKHILILYDDVVSYYYPMSF